MVKKSESADLKIKRKKWVQLISPQFNDIVIGETPVTDIRQALHKKVKINYMTISGDPRKQNIDIIFKIDSLRGETALIANTIGYQIQFPALRRLVRKGKTKVQDSFKCMTADNKPVVIKTFILTRALVNRALETKIRHAVKNKVVNLVSKTTFENFISDVIQSKIQKEIQDMLNKIYPIKVFEFYNVCLLENLKGKFEKPVAEMPKQEDTESEEAQQDQQTEESSDQESVLKNKKENNKQNPDNNEE